MISALGRPFDLGMLYDCRSDTLIVGKTLWSHKNLNEARNIIPKPFTSSEVFVENSIEDKANALNIQAGLKLSFLSGLVNVEGAAKYLNDTKTSQRQSRVVLKYETITELKQLTMEHLGAGKVQYPEVFDNDIATHVVVGILYGAKAFMVFDKEVSKQESLKNVHGSMKVLVKALPGIKVDDRGYVDITEDQKKNTENMRCKMYGDFRTSESPTTFEDAVKVYQQLPSLIGQNGENAVPIEVYLCALSDIDSKCHRMVREISADLVSKTSATLQNLHSLTEECKDLVQQDICSYFPRLKKQLAAFRENVERYRTSYQTKVLSVLPKVRGGGAEEKELVSLIDANESSPFSRKAMQSWLEDKKGELERLEALLKNFGETPLVSPKAVSNELYDLSIKYLVCFTFRISGEEDLQLSSMDAYLSEKDILNENGMLKVDEKSTYKKVRDALKHFVILKSINKENDEVNFLATDEPLTLDYEGSTGAFIKFYEDGEIKNEDLCSRSKPSNLNVDEASDSTLKLSWDDFITDKDDAKSYKVQYKDELNSGRWSSVYVEPNAKEKPSVTLTNLQPATTYHVKVCFIEKIIISEYSDVLLAATKPSSPPGKPYIIETTSNAIEIGFDKPQHVGKDVKIERYKVQWSDDHSWNSKAQVQYTDNARTMFTAEDLKPRTAYVFKVTANCDKGRESNASPSSDPFSTTAERKQFKTEKLLGSCQLLNTPDDGALAVYGLPLTLVHEDADRQLRTYEVNLGEQRKSSRVMNKPNKVIMMVGSTGSGKTSLVNAMVNYILGVRWKDNFRLKMIHEVDANQQSANIGNQIISRTKFVTCYTLHHLEAFTVPYTITMVDTPGFGDTRGIEQDEKVTEQIRSFFNTATAGGIDHLDAVCFLAQAGIPRLTPTQRYVFEKILSMFGKDIQANTAVLFTFADDQMPLALPLLKEANILDKDGVYFKFNNSGLFVNNSEQDDENFYRMSWAMGARNFEKFFKILSDMELNNLFLTKEVLNERAQLQVNVSGLKDKISYGIRLQKEKKIFNKHQANDFYLYLEKKVGLPNEFEETKKIVLALIEEMQSGLKRLSEIELKKDPLQQTAYLDLLIRLEELQAKPGFKERVTFLRETQKQAEEINRIARPGYDPWKEYRE